MPAMDLSVVWAAIIVVGVIMYVVMDGFDLGVGILFAWAPEERDRDLMMNSIAPLWDGNETWLILGGVAILAAFPAAYGTLLPALYLPVFVFLFGLIFRGVAFEFRHLSHHAKRPWGIAFAAGSTVAAFSQGVILGAYIQGFSVTDGAFSGGAFDWLSAFSLFTGLSLIAGYALLGATWLVMKTEGELQEWCFTAARWLMVAVLVAMAGVSLWTPFIDQAIADRWFDLPGSLYLFVVPFLTALVFFLMWRGIERRHEKGPFVFAILAFLLGFFGLAISLWPYIVPRQITIWEATSSADSQAFLLVGTLILLPVVLIYTGHNYWVFRGKAKHHDGYQP